jgi:(2R)-ethylmalonyl-CoA mutase
VQEIAYAMCTAIAVLDAVRDSGQVPPEKFGEVVARISFFVNAGVRFVEEMCKMRAFVQICGTSSPRSGTVSDPEARRFRYGVQVNSLGLTEAQPENNVQRIVLEMLAVTLSKDARARAVQLPAWNEALGLPRPWDQQWSLRIQQVLAFESDLLEYDDIFTGSSVIEAKVAELVAGAKAEIARVQEMGGAVAAVESGYMKSALVASHALRRQRIEAGEDVVVGLNQFTSTEPNPLTADLGHRDPDRRPGRRAGGRFGRPGVAAARDADPGRRRAPKRLWRGCKAEAPERRQPHAGHPGVRPGQGDDGRVGPGIAGRVRRIPRSHRRFRFGGGGIRCHAVRRSGCRAGPGGAHGRGARREAAGPGRQARPGRPQQWRRADRGARPGRRLRGDLPGHPADPEQIVAAAVAEDVHLVGLSILSGSHMELVPDVLRGLREATAPATCPSSSAASSPRQTVRRCGLPEWPRSSPRRTSGSTTSWGAS